MHSVTHYSNGETKLATTEVPELDYVVLTIRQMIAHLESNGYIVIDNETAEVSRYVTNTCLCCGQPKSI